MSRLIIAQAQDDLGHLARHMSHLMHRVLQSRSSSGDKSADWSPAVDVTETADRYEIVAELAGVRREDIEVYTEQNYLTIAGWRGDPTCREKVGIHQMEIEQGQFLRRLPLPTDAEADKVTARHRDGLLYISIPKRPAPAK